jgi:hypothetical protein
VKCPVSSYMWTVHLQGTCFAAGCADGSCSMVLWSSTTSGALASRHQRTCGRHQRHTFVVRGPPPLKKSALLEAGTASVTAPAFDACFGACVSCWRCCGCLLQGLGATILRNTQRGVPPCCEHYYLILRLLLLHPAGLGRDHSAQHTCQRSVPGHL